MVMTWILYTAGALAALVAIVAGVGAALPRDHKAARKATFANATPERVWDLISGPQDWRPDLSKWEKLDATHYVETDKRGQRMPMAIVESQPPNRRVTRIDDPGLPFGGTWTLTLAPKANGSEVRIVEDGYVGNVIFRFMARFVFGHTMTMEAYLKNLAAKLGEPNVQIEE